MVVLATDNKGTPVANQLLIFDKIENDILNKANNLFGYGSSYKLSLSFSLDDPNVDPDFSMGYSLKILDTIDLTGDLSKEIIVQFMAQPSGTSGYYQIGIFSYSYDTHTYYLLGTYPSSNLYDVSQMQYPNIVSTVFHQGDYRQRNLYNKNELFNLEYGTMDDNSFFITNEYSTYLIRTQMIWGPKESHIDAHRHIVSVFQPHFDSITNELEWSVMFSKETDKYISYCSKEFIQEFLQNNGKSWIMSE